MRRALSSLLLTSALFTAQTTHAQARAAPVQPPKTVAQSLTGDAQRDFVDGTTLFNAGDWTSALVKFGRAYAASKEPRILYNMASCHEKLKHYVLARLFLRQYIAEASAVGLIDDKRRAQLAVFLETYDRLIGKIVVRTGIEGAAVEVDGSAVGTTPLPGPLDIEEGSHRVRLSKPGHRDWSALVEVLGGQRESIVEAQLEIVRHQGRLIVQVTPKDATIKLDGVYAGLGAIDQLTPSGPHHLVVSAKGWRPREFEAVVVDDQTRRFDLTLDAEPRSYVWVWVAGGAAVVAGAIVTGVVLANQKDTLASPNTENGTTSLPLWGKF